MPELPEVETIRRQLAEAVDGARWETLTARPSSLFRTPARAVAERLKGAKLDMVERRGKTLLFCFEGGWVLLAHLGMSGQILLTPPAEPQPHHRHLTVHLNDGRQLVFRDPRRFGFLKLVRREAVNDVKELANVGADPLDPALTWDKFASDFKARESKVKPLLMSQRLFAGIGNVYADEILYHARVRPARLAIELSPVELKELYHAIRQVLSTAIGYGGTSFDEAFVDLYGRPGLYGGCLKVYGRGGEPCMRCNTPLKAVQIGGRSSVFCSHCQK